MIINTENIDQIRQRAFEIDACISIVIIEEAMARGLKIEMPFNNFKLLSIYPPESEIPIEFRRVATHKTSAVSLAITKDKALCYRVAESVGMRILPWIMALSKESALEFYESQDGCCIIKPLKGQGGRGIVTSFSGVDDFVARYLELKDGDDVIVQAKSMGSFDVRVLFIDQKFVAATSTRPTTIIGNGNSTLSELIATENAVRISDNTQRYPTMTLKELQISDAVNISGYELDQIIPLNTTVLVSLSNVSKGGISSDITAKLHRSFIEEAEKLVKRLHIPVIAIDFIAEQIEPEVSLEDSNAYFLEANSTPGIDMQMYPHEGEGRNVAGQFIDYLLQM